MSEHRRPLLFVDVDGVISLFGFEANGALPGVPAWVDGALHVLSRRAGRELVRLSEAFDLVWATGWEEKANEYLPRLLELPWRELPVVRFDGAPRPGGAHWKLNAIERFAGGRPLAWIDDNLDRTCWAWARERSAPTLLVATEPAIGLTPDHTRELLAWAGTLVR